jgi:fructose-specific phosphotransferase system IIC component
MRHAYEALLRFYPSSYRMVFAQEMTSVFEQAAVDCQPRGFLAYAGFLSTEFAGLLAGAFSMWADEYMARSSRRRVSPSFLLSLLAGAAITLFFQGTFYRGMSGVRRLPIQPHDAPPVTPDVMLPLMIAGGVLIFISVFSVAFVWNMRMIGNRSGRMKPIWMPSRAASSRPPRRAPRVRERRG